MAKFQILEYKNGKFLTPQQIDKALDKGDLITVEGVSYFVIDSEFPSNINPSVIVWPCKLSFPFDFMEQSFLFDWLRIHFKGLVIEASDKTGKSIRGKVVELYFDKTSLNFPDYSTNPISHKVYVVEYINKVKVLRQSINYQYDQIEIPLDQYPNIEVKNDY
jgi:hypothetical protein